MRTETASEGALQDPVRVPVLMYHRVGDAHNDWERKYCVAPGLFAAHMHALARRGHRAISIDDFMAWLRGEATPAAGSLLLTFDDGFLGVCEHARPVLTDLGWPATVFLVTGLVGGHDDWCRSENPSGRTYPLLGLREIDAMMKSGFSFHSHTRSHKRLTELTDDELAEQLSGSRQDVTNMLGISADYLAYPYGKYDDRVITATQRAGYTAAFSVQPGFNQVDVDRYRIRRLDVFGTDGANALLRKVRLGSNDGSLQHAASYYLARLTSRLRGAGQ